MMKKAISLLAALSLTVTAAGAQLTTFAEENTLITSESAADESSSENEEAAKEDADYSETTDVSEAEDTGTAEDDFPDTMEEIEQYAIDTQDPQYGKYLAMKAEYNDALIEANASDFVSMFGAMRTSFNAESDSNINKYTNRELYHNSRFDNYDKVYGVDVSQFQYNIDWNKVKADGIDFAIIRLGYRGWGRAGTLCTDPYFTQNMRGAAAAGVNIGIYFYTQAITVEEAKQEADYCLSYLRNYNIQMPVYFDMEGVDETNQGRLDNAGLTRAQKTEICCAFCDRIIAAGYKAGIYSNVYWLNNMIDGPLLETKYPIWLANYTTRTYYTGKYHMWQYSSLGYVDGIPTNVDVNVDYREREAMVPVDLNAKVTGNTAQLSWTDQGNSDKYEVYKVNGSNYALFSTVNSPSCSIPVTDQVVKYAVRSVKKMTNGRISYSDYSEPISLSNKMITGFKATADTRRITLKWDALSGASGYVVYRSENGGSYRALKEVTTASYTDSTAEAAVKYSYKVAPYFGTGNSKAVGADTLAAHTLLKPKKISGVYIKTASSPASEIKIKFSHVTKASGYQVATYDSSARRYDIVATVPANSFYYTLDTLPANTKRSIAVRAYYEAGGLRSDGDWSKTVDGYTSPKAPVISKITATPTYSKVEWAASSGASSYTVYKKSGSTYVKVAQTTGTSYTVNDNSASTRTYAVKASSVKGSKTYTSGYSTAVSINGKTPEKVVITSASASGSNAKLTWNAVPGVTGYRVYMRDPATGTYKGVKTVNARYTSCTVAGSGSSSTYRVKAFRRETAGTVWGSPSNVKTVRF
ncbi:MAG: hypothetical protein J6M17_01555 [Ruminococcus sp.]|nr:hypothetical protein [Ruminococcus sp.]